MTSLFHEQLAELVLELDGVSSNIIVRKRGFVVEDVV